MNKWNNLLAALDAAVGFPNQTNSTFRKTDETYDDATQEHVVVLEYRVRVNPGRYQSDFPLVSEINNRIR